VTGELADLLARLFEILQKPGVIADDGASLALREALGNSAAILRSAARVSAAMGGQRAPPTAQGEQADSAGRSPVGGATRAVSAGAVLPPTTAAQESPPGAGLRAVAPVSTLPATASDAPAATGAQRATPSPVPVSTFELGAEAFFGARHFVTIDGRQGPPHHHSWRVEATIESSAATSDGVVVGFARARDLLESLIKPLNRTLLNGIPPFDSIQPTAENLAKYLFAEFRGRFEEGPARLRRVRVWESPTSHATYLENS
jgi:6-pyruvoyltetrahydropterin/6-carboxytetrahydropterin synthase